MTAHNNIYIPRESFPTWIWYVLELVIITIVSTIISNEFMKTTKEIEDPIYNWMFWSITGTLFILWYILIRKFVLRKISI